MPRSPTPMICRVCGGPAVKHSHRDACSWQCRLKAIAAPFAGQEGCWNWPRALSSDGYGLFDCRKSGTKITRAHRASYAAFVGQIPDGMLVCHRCDNPKCFNPAHLFLGEPAANTDDMLAKGRGGARKRLETLAANPGTMPRGEAHYKALLTEEQVREIRATPKRTRGLTEKYGVSYYVICDIRRGKSWKHV